MEISTKQRGAMGVSKVVKGCKDPWNCTHKSHGFLMN